MCMQKTGSYVARDMIKIDRLLRWEQTQVNMVCVEPWLVNIILRSIYVLSGREKHIRRLKVRIEKHIYLGTAHMCEYVANDGEHS